jgi:uncharacterized protein YjdB
MKKKILLFMMLIMLPLFVYACDDTPDIEITAVTISGETRVQIGTTEAYVATIIPNTALDKNVTWSVINITGEATINQAGILTPTLEGTVRVVATAVNGVEGVRNVTIVSGTCTC